MTKPNDKEAILYAFTLEAADDKVVDLASELRLGGLIRRGYLARVAGGLELTPAGRDRE